MLEAAPIPPGPVVIAAGVLLAGVLVPALRSSRTPAARALVRNLFDHGPEPTAEQNGQVARQLALIGFSAIIAGFLFFWIADHWPINTPRNNQFSGVGLFLAFGGTYSAWHGFKRWRLSRAAKRKTKA